MAQRLAAARVGAIERRLVVHAEAHAPAAVVAGLGPEAHAPAQRRKLELRAARAPSSSIRRALALVALARRPGGSAPRRHLAVALEHALDPQPVEAARVALGVGRRVDDPERRGRGVLGRPGRVRVEGVALVEERVDELLQRRAHRASARARQQLRHGGVVRQQAALGRVAAQRGERVLAHADEAAAAPRAARQTSTGRRNWAVDVPRHARHLHPVLAVARRAPSR